MRIREEIIRRDGAVFPGKTFADAVLEPVFNIQRDHYYHIFLEISLAHAVMLAEQGILTGEEAAGILKGLLAVRSEDFSKAAYNPAFEDMFFTLEKELSDRIGRDLAGRLHIARSRNDVGICEFRLALRNKLLRVIEAMLGLLETLLSLAEEHVDTIMPAYTHTQPAQPTTYAHYLLAFHDVLSRSLPRFFAAYHGVNRSPLGAAAITTTGFPISRERTCALLGFDGLVENAYDAIAGVDYISESASALMVLGVDLSRFLKDTLDFCTREYGYYRLADPYVQTSSIMPQKRNPSSLEHARPIASAIIGQAQTVFTMLHNTPFGDMVDSEEQLQPHLYGSIENALRALALLTSVYATMTVDKDLMLRRAGEGFITATELADALVREKGLSFRQSHEITAKLVRALSAQGRTEAVGIPAESFNGANSSNSRRERDPGAPQALSLPGGLEVDQALVAKSLDPVHFVRIRQIRGGPAPREAARMLKDRWDALRRWEQEGKEMRAALAKAGETLTSAVSAYLA